MSNILILILLFANNVFTFEIQVIASNDPDKSVITVTGENVRDIRWTTDLAPYGFTEESLYKMAKVLNGNNDFKYDVIQCRDKMSLETYSHNSNFILQPSGETKVGILPHAHQTLNLTDVSARTKATKTSVVQDTKTDDIILASTVMENKSSNVTGTFTSTLTKEITYGVTSSSTNTNQVEINEQVNYKIGFLGTGVGGETSFTYGHEWSDTQTKETTKTFTSSHSVEAVLEPGQKVVANLITESRTLELEVVLTTKFDGYICYIYYDDPFKTPHRCNEMEYMIVRNAMENDYFKPAKTIRIKIDFFTQSRVTLTDPVTKKSVNFKYI